MKKPVILVFCAHNDDQVIGAGGTLAKYAKEGCRVKSIIFSFGESSHPHLKANVVAKMRIKESLDADKIMGGSGVAYLGVGEGKFPELIKKKDIRKRLLQVIKKEKPVKVFAHSVNDPHPDHRAIGKLVESMCDDIACSVYSFEVWTLFRLRNRYHPRLVEDISSTFKTKLKAIRAHKSQRVAIANLFLSVIIKAKLNGLIHGFRYAEVFDKLK